MEEQTHTPTPQYSQQPNEQTSGRAIASMVLGICSIVTCFMYGIPSLVCGILALMYAKKAEHAIAAGEAPESSRGMLKAGRVCGWIGLSLSIVYLLFFIIYVVIIVGILGAAAASGANNPTLLPF